ncbi:MAG TPA: helix-turn-helix domain-containing protein, partial [Nitrospirota bacterium]
MLHALDIIESFMGAKEGLGVTEQATRLKLHKNNVFR